MPINIGSGTGNVIYSNGNLYDSAGNIILTVTKRSRAPLYWPLRGSLALQNGSGTPTFTRATTATTFNTEGNIVNIPSGAVRFAGARPVVNWFPDSSKMATSSAWSATNFTKNAAVGPDGVTNDGCLFTCTANSGSFISIIYDPTVLGGNVRTYKFLYKPGTVTWIRMFFYDSSSSDRVTIWFNATTNAFGTVSTTGTSWSLNSYSLTASTAFPGWYEVYVVATSPITGSPHAMTINFSGVNGSVDYTNVNGQYFTLAYPQLENSTGRTDKTPSEYVATGLSAPYYGAGADGVKYFATYKDGTPIPEANLLGARLNPNAITNNLLYCRDLTNAAWVKTNVTAALTQIGIDGRSNACSLLTATATDGTVLQTITAASAAACSGFYVKRSVGTGSIYFTRDGGANWTDITNSINSSTFTLVKIENTSVLNPQVGFKVATSGDAIIVDAGINHLGTQISETPVLTTSASVTVNADVLTAPTSGNFSDTAGTILATVTRDDWTTGNGSAVGSSTLGLYTSSANSGAQGLDGTNTVNGPTGTPSGSMKIGLRWSGTSLQVYSNGVFGNAGSYDGGFNLSSIALAAGAQCTIKDVAIWNTSLSDTEMVAAANNI